MRKIIVTASLLVAVTLFSGCKEKRCHCVTMRPSEILYPAHSLEPLGNHKNCAELNMEWMASDSSMEMLEKTCVEEE